MADATFATVQASITLKPDEPAVLPDTPWSDDELGRQQVAQRLTNFIQNQTAPFVISIDGHWGTGKTFLLKRWHQDLENRNYKAIYFNAWEDDFCDDPLLAILGQLADYFKETGFKEMVNQAAKDAMLLLRQNILGIVRSKTGVTFEIENKQDPLDAYISQSATKNRLKQSLAEMSRKAHQETAHPIVFIIDELDRCRPTFAVELLERVKHIFDVRSIVFVFGINRNELCASLQSIYGSIDADVYLRRFFDMEFTLPEANANQFCQHLIKKFELARVFNGLSQSASNQVHADEFQNLTLELPAFWGRLDLSLRDIDYCFRMIALVATQLQPGQYMHSVALSLLIPLKLKNPALYRQFIQGNCLAKEVIDYIYGSIANPLQDLDSISVNLLDSAEAMFYCADRERPNAQPPALDQLISLSRQQMPAFPDNPLLQQMSHLTEKTKMSNDEHKILRLARLAEKSARIVRVSRETFVELAGLIDLFQESVRR